MTLSLNKELPKWRQFYILTKPRVTQLAVFCAIKFVENNVKKINDKNADLRCFEYIIFFTS